MSKRDVIVVGASAGGLDVVRQLVSQLPSNFTGAVFVVWHLSRDYPSQLAQILARSTVLPVTQAIDGEKIESGHIYVARPDHHLMVEEDRVRVTKGPTENRFRPSVDVLFRSAAMVYGPRVVAIILSGSLDDGAAGFYAVHERGGKTIVQDPVEAPYFDMPINAMKAVDVDYVLPVARMGEVIVSLTGQVADLDGAHPVTSRMEIEVNIAREDYALEAGGLELGEPSIFTCPECHGTLLKIKEGDRLRFRCHTGHAFSLNTLLSEVTKSIEDTLWSGVRVIEESEMLLTHMARHLEEAGHPEVAQRFWKKAEKASQQAKRVRDVVLENEVLSQEKIDEELPSQFSSQDNRAEE